MVSILSSDKRPAFLVGEEFKIRGPLPTRDQLRVLSRSKVKIDKDGLPIKRVVDIPFALSQSRPSFKLSAPAPRSVIGLKESEALLIKQKGIKIRFDLPEIEVQAKDEAGNLIFDSSGNPVMIKKQINLAELIKPTEILLRNIRQDVADLAVLTGIQKDALALQIGEVLRRAELTQDFSQITAQNLLFFQQALKTMGISRNPVAAGITTVDGRFVTNEEWKKSGSMILMWLLANLPPSGTTPLTLQQPVFGLSDSPVQMERIKVVLQQQTALGNKPVVDLLARKIWKNLSEARAALGIPPAGLDPGDIPEVSAPIIGPDLTAAQLKLLTGDPSVAPIPPASVEEEKKEEPSVEDLAETLSAEQILQQALASDTSFGKKPKSPKSPKSPGVEDIE